MTEARDFWISSGFGLLERDADGRMTVTDAFLRALLARPEIAPVAESCAAERNLHAALLEDPRRPVSETELAAFADPDGRENYQIVLGFRDALLAAGNLEAFYLATFREGGISIPPLFLDQVAHVVCRNMLEGVADPFRARAAELLFRSQRVTLQDGTVMCADEEIVDMHAAGQGYSSLERLIAENDTPLRSVELDVLTEENAAIYWERSNRFDTVLDLTFTRPGLDAFCRVLESWVEHFLGVEVSVTPVRSIADEKWVWHIGLDSTSSAILNALYKGEDVPEEELVNLLALFRLEFKSPEAMMPSIAGRPVYLGLAQDPSGVLRMKPQNLLVNLPLAPPA